MKEVAAGQKERLQSFTDPLRWVEMLGYQINIQILTQDEPINSHMLKVSAATACN